MNIPDVWRRGGELLRLERVVCSNPDCEEVFMVSKVICPNCGTKSPHKDLTRSCTHHQRVQEKKRQDVTPASQNGSHDTPDNNLSAIAYGFLAFSSSESKK